MAIKGHIVTLETRLKLRLANLGKKQSKETCEKKRILALGNQYRLGIQHSEETKRKMSISHTGLKANKTQIDSLIGNKYRLGIPHTQETKDKMSESRNGSKNSNWKNGVTPINRSIRTSKEFKEWRRQVFERDDYTCQNKECGRRSGINNRVIIHADHIKPFALYPELRFVLSNGRTLCKECHEKTDTYCGRTNKRNI